MRFFYFSFHIFLIISLIFKLGNIGDMKRNVYLFFLFSSIYLLFGPWMFIEVAGKKIEKNFNLKKISDDVFGAVFTIGILRLDNYSFIPNVDIIHTFSIWYLYFSFSLILLYFVYEKNLNYYLKLLFGGFLLLRLHHFWYFIARNRLSIKSVQISSLSPCGFLFFSIIFMFYLKTLNRK